jgi:hypothetical protein
MSINDQLCEGQHFIYNCRCSDMRQLFNLNDITFYAWQSTGLWLNFKKIKIMKLDIDKISIDNYLSCITNW